MDRGGARLLETLDDLKLAENTVVLLASDNGPWKLYWPEIPRPWCDRGDPALSHPPTTNRTPRHGVAPGNCRSDTLPEVRGETGCTEPLAWISV